MIQLLHGDCRDLLPTLPESSVQCVVTSPPYWGLRDYGVSGQLGLEATPEEYLTTMVGVFREVRRVLRDDGTLWMNMGDGYATAGHSACDGDVKGDNLTGGGLRAWGEHRQAVKGTVGLTGLKPKDLVGMPWRLAFALQADGWYLRSDIIWAKPNPMPESVTDRPTKSHEYVFLLTKNARYYYDADAVSEKTSYPVPATRDPSGDYSNGSGRNDGGMHRSGGFVTGARRNLRTVWTIATEPTPEAHFATFPRKLVTPCILAGTKMGDTVLDPFGGTGTVGRVAEDLGRDAILIELNATYLDFARRKTAQRGLFASPDGIE